MATKTKKTTKTTPKKGASKAKTPAKAATEGITHNGRKMAGIIGAILVPVATVAIGYGLSRYYGINLPTKVMSLMK